MDASRPRLTAVSTAVDYPPWLVRLRSVTVDVGVSAYKLAQTTRMSERHLNTILNGGVISPHPASLARIAAAIGQTLEWIQTGDDVVQELEVGLSQVQVDVLNACAYLNDCEPGTLLREAVTQYVKERRTEEDVKILLNALESRRKSRAQ